MPASQTRIQSYFRTRYGPFAVVVIIALCQAFIADSVGIITGSLVWMLPVVTLVLLLLSIFAYPARKSDLTKRARFLSIAVIVFITLVNISCMVWFITDMLSPQSVTEGHTLLIAGLILWVVNVGIYALAYWELDSGGPEMRATGGASLFRNKTAPDIVFPQQDDDSGRVSKNWTPSFIDYLYMSVTAATSFSPAAATPYSSVMKVLLGSESLISLATLGIIIARAIFL